MRTYLKLSLISLPIMLVLDFVWIGFIANGFYRAEYGSLYSPHIVWQAAALFYVIYILGLVYFVIAPSVRNLSLKEAVWKSAFFALVAFGTYDLTSLSITANWPVLLSVVDMSWGIFNGIVTATLTYLIATKFLKSV